MVSGHTSFDRSAPSLCSLCQPGLNSKYLDLIRSTDFVCTCPSRYLLSELDCSLLFEFTLLVCRRQHHGCSRADGAIILYISHRVPFHSRLSKFYYNNINTQCNYYKCTIILITTTTIIIMTYIHTYVHITHLYSTHTYYVCQHAVYNSVMPPPHCSQLLPRFI